MTAISTNVYIDKLLDIINEYNNTYHRTTKMNPADVKSSSCILNLISYPKFKIGIHIKISEYKNVFAKSCVSNCSKEVFVIKKLKILCREYMLLVMLGSIIGTFYRNKLKNTNQTEFRVEKVIKRKDDVK